MNKYLTLTVIIILQVLVSFAQSDEIPTNKETGLVSISKVVRLSDTSMSIKQIKEQVQNFIKSNSNLGQSPNPYKGKKSKAKMPNFIGGKLLDEDSLVIYNIGIDLGYLHTSGLGGQMGGDMVEVKLKLYIKTGKFKYDFTNMTHSYVYQNIYKGLSGGKFENEKPENSGSLLTSKKGEWADLKKDAVRLVRNIARELENTFFVKPASSEFNF